MLASWCTVLFENLVIIQQRSYSPLIQPVGSLPVRQILMIRVPSLEPFECNAHPHSLSHQHLSKGKIFPITCHEGTEALLFL